MREDIKEVVGMLIILTLVIACLQWFLLRFSHWSVALIVTGFIAIVVSFFYVTLSNVSPNGGGSGSDVSAFITPTLVVFISLLCGLVLVSYFTHIKLPKTALILPLIMIVVFAIGRYMYTSNALFYNTNFSQCKIEVLDTSGGTSIVEEIRFQNTSNGISTSINPESKDDYSPALVRFADKIIFRGYSTQSNQPFFKSFPFDYSLFKEKEGARLGLYFWLRLKVALPIKIVLQPDNKVDLYLDNHLVKQYLLDGNELLRKVKK